MDKKILLEYADVKEEVKDLKRRIHKLETDIDKLEHSIVADTVTRGRKGKKPLGTVKITGTPNGVIGRKRTSMYALQARLIEKETELLELLNQVEEYIESIQKSELRVMFRFFFIDDLTYAKTAMEMNRLYPNRKIKYTDENVKKRIQRFF